MIECSNFSSWPDPRTQALAGIIGPLNQSFVDKRQVVIGCEVHETRMDDSITPFRQFNVPLNAIYTDGTKIIGGGANTSLLPSTHREQSHPSTL